MKPGNRVYEVEVERDSRMKGQQPITAYLWNLVKSSLEKRKDRTRVITDRNFDFHQSLPGRIPNSRRADVPRRPWSDNPVKSI
jgi:hypothetical protein